MKKKRKSFFFIYLKKEKLWYNLNMNVFWKKKTWLTMAAILGVSAFFIIAKTVKAVAPLYQSFSASASTGVVGTIRQIRVDPVDGKAYVLGSSVTTLGVFSADGSSFSAITYNVSLPNFAASDLAVSGGKIYIAGQGTPNSVYRYDIDGSVATFFASSTLSTGSPSITLGSDGTVYTGKSVTVSMFNTALGGATTATASSTIAKMAYGGSQLFYLAISGRFARTNLTTYDTTIATGGPSAGSAKGFAVSNNGAAIYYASASSLAKRAVSDGTLLWSKSFSNLAGFDFSTSSGRITTIDTSGVVQTYSPINAVSGLSASVDSDDVTLGWTTGVSDSDYRGVTIRRSTTTYPATATEGTAVTSTVTMDTSFVDSNLSDGVYYYTLFNETMDGYFSAGVTTTVTVAVPPEAPILEASKSGSTISLHWSAPADAVSYLLQRSTTGYPGSITEGTTVTSTIFNTLTQNEMSDATYYYSIFARDAEGNYSSAGRASVTVDVTPPSAPTLTAVASGSTVYLSWTAPATAVLYRLQRGTESFPSSIYEGVSVTSTSLTSLTQTSLDDGIHYYSIFASDDYENYSNAGTSSVTIDTTAPVAPSGFRATASGDTIILSWTNPVSDFSSSTIRRSTTGYPTSVTDGTAVTSTVSTSYSDTSLANGTYYYSIFAGDDFSNYSNVATAVATVYVVSGDSGSPAAAAPSAFFSAPLFSFNVNNKPTSGASTVKVTTPNIKLNLNANPGAVRGYSASLDASFKNAIIIPVNPNTDTNFILPNKTGIYTIYLKYYSPTGQASEVFTQTVSYGAGGNSSSGSNSTGPATPATPTVSTFKRTLQLGSKGDDVKALQQFLNAQGFVVSKNGPGSPGNETIIFGPATAKALVKFQEANADKILKPIGLKKGTGTFGAATINAISKLP